MSTTPIAANLTGPPGGPPGLQSKDGKKHMDPAAKAAMQQAYQTLCQQARALGITNIPAPGKGCMEALQKLIDAKSAVTPKGPGQQGNALFAGNTVGLNPNGNPQSTGGQPPGGLGAQGIPM